MSIVLWILVFQYLVTIAITPAPIWISIVIVTAVMTINIVLCGAVVVNMTMIDNSHLVMKMNFPTCSNFQIREEKDV